MPSSVIVVEEVEVQLMIDIDGVGFRSSSYRSKILKPKAFYPRPQRSFAVEIGGRENVRSLYRLLNFAR